MKTITLSLLLVACLANVQAQQLFVSTNSKFSSVDPGISDGKKFIVKAGKYDKIYTTKSCFIAVDKNGEIDLLDRNTAKKIGQQRYKFEDGFAWNIKNTVGSQHLKQYEHRFYILRNQNSEYKKYALYNLDMVPITDFIYDGIYGDRLHSSKKIALERLIVKKDDKFGLMLENGTVLIEPKYKALKKPNLFADDIHDVFEVMNPEKPNELLYYIHPDDKIAYGANALRFFRVSSTEFNLKEAMNYLLSNLNDLKPEDKSVIGYINVSPFYTKTPNYDEGFEWLVKAYKEKQTYYTAQKLAYFLDREKQYVTYLEQSDFYIELLKYLSNFSNAYAYKLGAAYAYGKGVNRDVDKAIEYYNKTTNTSENVLYDATVTSAFGELAKLYNEKNDVKNRDRALLWYMRGGRKDNPLTGKTFANRLSVGQVVSYQNKPAAIAAITLDGVILSDGRKIPATSTEYTILNTSNANYLVKCKYCYGSGKVTRTYKNVTTYLPTHTTKEYIAGSSITGPQIKTTTTGGPITQDIHVEGQCSRCNGTGKILPANSLERN
ncbi:MAG: hypothetical protein ACO1N4_07975 [Pedobacter sp.]